MSVQGTILVLDGETTNRIMLEVQLTAAWYHVAQGDKLSGLGTQLGRVQPDLVLTALTLPDGRAADVKKLLQLDPRFRNVPVVAIAGRNDKPARLRALSDGLDDVISFPVQDNFLLARVRSLLRTRTETQDLDGKNSSQPIGFAEAPTPALNMVRTGRVVFLAKSTRTSILWQKALAESTHTAIVSRTLPNLSRDAADPGPDAIVVELSTSPHGLNTLTEIRSRTGPRRTAIIGVISCGNTNLAAEALDRGADAVCVGGFCAQELSLRINAHMARRSITTKYRMRSNADWKRRQSIR